MSRAERPAAETFADEFELRSAVESWVICRDAGLWDRFAAIWHPKGRMVATWFQAAAPDFIARSKRAFEGGMKGLHTLGGIDVEIAGDRAIVQSKMQIMQRGPVHDIEVDVICTGRFYDFFERYEGRWALYLRQPIYELDRISPVDPGATAIPFDRALLDSFPEGYRHLAYLQTLMGFEVSRELPGTRGPAVEALYARGARWLAGEPGEP